MSLLSISFLFQHQQFKSIWTMLFKHRTRNGNFHASTMKFEHIFTASANLSINFVMIHLAFPKHVPKKTGTIPVAARLSAQYVVATFLLKDTLFFDLCATVDHRLLEPSNCFVRFPKANRNIRNTSDISFYSAFFLLINCSRKNGQSRGIVSKSAT